MPRAVKDTRLDTRAARARLKLRGKPYYRAIDHGLHLGYRKGGRAGRWVARVYQGEQRYLVETIGTADDHAEADGLAVLDWSQAQAKARERMAALAREQAGVEEPAMPYTVADAIKAYREWLAEHRKPTAVRDLDAANRAHIEPTLGTVELEKLTKDKLQDWHKGLAKKPRRLRTKRGAEQRYRELADDPESIRRRRDTANRVRTILFAALNHAFQNGKVASDAAWRKVKPFPETSAARARYLDLDECRRLMNACEPDFRRLVRGGLVTGARYGELCAADVRDFEARTATLFIANSKVGQVTLRAAG